MRTEEVEFEVSSLYMADKKLSSKMYYWPSLSIKHLTKYPTIECMWCIISPSAKQFLDKYTHVSTQWMVCMTWFVTLLLETWNEKMVWKIKDNSFVWVVCLS